MRQAVVFGVLLALVFGRDALEAVGGAARRGPAPPLDADAGRSANYRVHVAFCTS
jgi:hypothetical protein